MEPYYKRIKKGAYDSFSIFFVGISKPSSLLCTHSNITLRIQTVLDHGVIRVRKGQTARDNMPLVPHASHLTVYSIVLDDRAVIATRS